MYNEIASNKRKTVLLMTIAVLVLLAFGWAYGQYTGDVAGGLALAAIFSIGGNVVSYFASDKIALASSGAKQIEKTDNPELYRIVENLAITAGVPMPRVAIINDSAMNAFATGRNPEHAVVAVTTGLLERLNKNELEGVIAHELSHVRNYDILLMTVVVVLIGTMALLADMFHWGSMGRRSNQREDNNFGFIIALVLLIVAPLIGQLIKLAVSRKREFLADASGALLTRYPEGLASALEKISTDPQPLKRVNHATAHLFISNPFKSEAFSNLLSTHPPAEERIRRLREML
ncbi:zinc metalloprotease HtpX [Candidatus Uhrbacteria bacterium CG10_big_fil_rev_8_21_14_0_10_50_16]|uniref:Protease HtpX homolog n=1 Tax=Candidatus Uhrbacteria bacterium CG10_big_fil_rev_8_21_14_0_10_50_16 TaxID=1975039 RepID=A0A2H0RNH0_9BACT|nr:MAG: zinc metalloprotease HtpX [Candidatus Uhrbacteria bacterium CG10_big_fil_rev_8_21_14_0_10_50_16]